MLRKDVESDLKNLIDELNWMLRKSTSEDLKTQHTSIYARIDEINLTNNKNRTKANTDSSAKEEKAA